MLQLNGEAAKHVIECELGVRIHGTTVMLKAGVVVVGKIQNLTIPQPKYSDYIMIAIMTYSD